MMFICVSLLPLEEVAFVSDYWALLVYLHALVQVLLALVLCVVERATGEVLAAIVA
jgi:hypothetical protein